MAPDTAEEFRVGSVLGPEGLGGNGQKLLDAFDVHNPPELRAVTLKRVNAELDAKLDEKAWRSAAKIAEVPKLAGLTVRGGHEDSDQATVVYVRVDNGVASKGFFPYRDLGSDSSDGHFSQRQALLDSDFAQNRPQSVEPGQPPEPVDPFAALANASADELVSEMREHPDRAEAIKAFEQATRGEKARKTVLDFDPAADSDSGQS